MNEYIDWQLGASWYVFGNGDVQVQTFSVGVIGDSGQGQRVLDEAKFAVDGADGRD